MRPVSHRATTDWDTPRARRQPSLRHVEDAPDPRRRPGTSPSNGPMRYQSTSSAVHPSICAQSFSVSTVSTCIPLVGPCRRLIPPAATDIGPGFSTGVCGSRVVAAPVSPLALESLGDSSARVPDREGRWGDVVPPWRDAVEGRAEDSAERSTALCGIGGDGGRPGRVPGCLHRWRRTVGGAAGRRAGGCQRYAELGPADRTQPSEELGLVEGWGPDRAELDRAARHASGA